MVPALIFIHQGPTPDYLKIALEQARLSNSQAPIWLLGDRAHSLPACWRIQQKRLTELTSPALMQFISRYYHVSTNPLEFERFCFQRWFYIAELCRMENIQRAVAIDSDCMCFVPAEELFALFAPTPGIHICRSGSPHCTLINGSLQPLLDFFLQTFEPAKKSSYEARMACGQPDGLSWVLSDMFVMRDYLTEGGQGSTYWYDTSPKGVITAIMNAAEGFEVWPGTKILKRVYWRLENDRLVPYLKSLANGQLVRGCVLHYKGASKKRMARFNKPCPVIPNKWRVFLLNHFAPVNGPRWVG